MQVDGDHLAGAELALGDDVGGRVVPGADFAGNGEVAVGGQHPARGAQAVAVGGGRGEAAVAHHDAGRAVPGVEVEPVVLVEGREVGVLVLQRLRGRRDQDAHRGRQIEAAGEQHLQHVVQRLRVGAFHADQRVEVAEVDRRRAPLVRARLRPAPVALDGVDFAVVGQEAKRLRQLPRRRGVGREALVEDDHRRLHVLAREVGVELRQRGRQHHALVAQRPGRQRHHVERRLRGVQALLRHPACDEQRAVERGLVHRRRGRDEHLLDARHGAARGLAAGRRLGRHHAPAGDPDFLAFQFFRERGAAHGRGLVVGGQEDGAGGEHRAQPDAALGSGGAQEFLGAQQQHAAAVARGTVGRHRAAVREPRQRGQAGLDHPAGGDVIEVRDQPEATGIVLEPRVVEPLLRKAFVLARHAASAETHTLNAIPCRRRTVPRGGVRTGLLPHRSPSPGMVWGNTPGRSGPMGGRPGRSPAHRAPRARRTPGACAPTKAQIVRCGNRGRVGQDPRNGPGSFGSHCR